MIADIPHRHLNSRPLPVLVLVKDAHLYPVLLKSVSVFLNTDLAERFILNIKIDQPYFDRIFYLENLPKLTGEQKISVKMEYECRGKTYICFNDNYRGSSHRALACYFSAEALPRFPGCVYGDAHTHSNFTTDQVEFGASLQSTAEIGKNLGLHFFCATDHAYDLDDQPNNYLRNDPELKNWHAFLEQVKNYNRAANDFFILPGEEASVLNSKNQNIHLLLINNSEFYPGSGDSGEKWLHFYSEYSLNKLLNKLTDETLAFAAHPAEQAAFLQKRLLNRGNWSQSDLSAEGLDGLQTINSNDEAEQQRAIKMWGQLLLQGRKLSILAGNDSHGHFSRSREINIPFLSLKENRLHRFGFWRNGLYLNNEALNLGNISRCLKNGRYFISNGPALRLNASSSEKTWHMGETAETIKQIKVEALSSVEFGFPETIKIVLGEIGAASETVLWEETANENTYRAEKTVAIHSKATYFYVRAEITSRNRRGRFSAFSNPIWCKRK